MSNDRIQSARRLSIWTTFGFGLSLVFALLVSLSATGCANTEEQEMASRCHSDDHAACAQLDDERQARDQADYQVEPALGYLNLPAGISLPMPVAAHATADPSM